MDRKGIIAITLAVIVLVYWQIENSKRMAQVAREKQRAAEMAKAAEPQVPPGTLPENPAMPAAPVVPGAPPAPPVENVAPTIQPLDTAWAEYTFTNIGGGIQRVKLKNHKAEGDSPVTLNQFGTYPVGAVSEQPGDPALPPYTVVQDLAGGGVHYQRTDARQMQIDKKFTTSTSGDPGEEYVTTLEVTFTNRSTAPIQSPGYYVYTGSAAPIHQIDQATYTGFAWMPKGGFVFKDANSFGSGGFLGMGKSDTSTFVDTKPDTLWAGVTNQYFSSIITPLDAKGSGAWAHRFAVKQSLLGNGGKPIVPATDSAQAEGPSALAVDGALAMPGFTLQPGESQAQKFQIYAGPREYKRLKNLGHREEEIMDFGMFKAISKMLLSSLNWLKSKLGSYAVAIIVLTIIIRGLMWPLQNKGTQSMKRMQALQPKMTELKEKYKDDPTRMNTELMKLYKDYGINPLSGCIPMVVQIPIFFGFYSMLGKAVELRNAKFLWVQDLSQMDTIAWVLGQPLNVLPLLMAGTMLWQMALSPKSGDPVQQRMFMFMPVVFVLFCYKYASALALYWTVQNLFQVAQLYLTRNSTTPVLQKVSVPAKKR